MNKVTISLRMKLIHLDDFMNEITNYFCVYDIFVDFIPLALSC